MSIICTLIARKEGHQEADLESGPSFHILVEVSEGYVGNFPQVTRELVLKALPKEERSLFNYKGKYFFNILNKEGFVYICLTEENYSKIRAQTFLNEVRELFYSKYPSGQREKALSFSLEKTFSGALLEKMRLFNEKSVDPKISKIKDDAKQTLKIMEENMDSLMERGLKIELLVKKAQELKVGTKTLQERSGRLKAKARSNYLKRGALFAVSAIVVLWIVVL